MITAGNNIGRVGVVTHRERHHGGYDIVHIKDATEHTFATREGNVFIIGEGNKPWISLPKARGIKMSIAEGINSSIVQVANFCRTGCTQKSGRWSCCVRVAFLVRVVQR